MWAPYLWAPFLFIMLMSSCLGPQNALFFCRDRSRTPVNELLHTLPSIRFGCKQISIRVCRNTMYAIKLSGLASTVPETGQHFERVPQEDVNLTVLSVGNVNIFLLKVFRKGDIPY